MIDESRVANVVALLAQGLGQREISRRIGVSRSTVANIQHGRRKPRSAKAERADDPFPTGRRRCALCGALIYQPCIACRDRRLPDQRSQTLPEQPGHLIELSLMPDQLARYEEVREARRAGLDLREFLHRKRQAEARRSA